MELPFVFDGSQRLSRDRSALGISEFQAPYYSSVCRYLDSFRSGGWSRDALDAIGYMLGISLLHSFVVEDEKEDYRRELEEAAKRDQEQRIDRCILSKKNPRKSE